VETGLMTHKEHYKVFVETSINQRHRLGKKKKKGIKKGNPLSLYMINILDENLSNDSRNTRISISLSKERYKIPSHKQFEPHQMILVKETYDKCKVRGHIVYIDTSYDLPRLNKHSKK
jgi:hypothetical protein